jgi:hypothetical protein
VKEFLDTKALGYVYDNDSKCTRTAPQIVAQAAPSATASSGKPMQPIALNPTTTSVNVTIAEPKQRELTANSAGQTTLVLKDVSAQSDPGALLGVFVARKDKPSDRRQVGTINWFGVFDHADDTHQHEHAARTFKFDVTSALKALEAGNTSELTVIFEAISGLVGSGKQSNKTIAAPPPPAFQGKAGLRVGGVEIQ